jgi:hypothetical protein
VLDCRIKHSARLVDTITGVQQALDALIVFRPELDLVESDFLAPSPTSEKTIQQLT